MAESSDIVSTTVESSVLPTHSQELHHDNKLPTLMESLRNAAMTNIWFNLFFVFVPLGIAAEKLHWNATLVFVLNMIAIIPSAKMLDFATEETSKYVSQTLAGLLNATFGNAVELIVSVVALLADEFEVLSASLLGSILSNLLLVLGLAFFLGGLKYKFQHFSAVSANLNSGLLSVVVLAYLVPAAFDITNGESVFLGGPAERAALLHNLSKAASILLLMTYVAYIIFQLKTHSKVIERSTGGAVGAGYEDPKHNISNVSDEEDHKKLVTLPVAICLLLGITVLIGFNADALVSSIDEVSHAYGLSKVFIGLIIIPLVGNAAEHASAVSAAMRDKMDLSIAVALGSTIQIALFVSPLLVIIGWATGHNFDLVFDTFGTVVVFLTVFVTNNLISDGTSNWMEGWVLLTSYLLIAVAVFFIHPKAANGAVPAHTGH